MSHQLIFRYPVSKLQFTDPKSVKYYGKNEKLMALNNITNRNEFLLSSGSMHVSFSKVEMHRIQLDFCQNNTISDLDKSRFIKEEVFVKVRNCIVLAKISDLDKNF